MKKLLLILLELFIFMNPSVTSAQSRIIEFEAPKMKVFLPPAGMSNGKAVVVCPGGGYTHLAPDHEGYQWAPLFNNLGFAYAVVEYRLPDGNKNIPMDDVKRCFGILADNAAEWNIDADKIGIMGFSAGGHLASSIATHPVDGCRPAFQILFYPVISLDAAITHGGTRRGFLGDNPDMADVEEWSSDKKVNASTPPAILILCSDDKVVKPINGIKYYNALVENNVPAAMFVYPFGGHGWGYQSGFRQHEQMVQELTAWLKNIDYRPGSGK